MQIPLIQPKELRRILNERLPKLNRWKQKLETSNIHHQKIQDIVVTSTIIYSIVRCRYT